MFGIGPQEVVVIVLLLLVVFGPGKAMSMVRDLGRFVSEARSQIEEFKDELLDGGEDQDELANGSSNNYITNEIDKREVGQELPWGEEVPPAEVNGQPEQRH
jgi:Sec-independent protein translocase protein TatA